METRAHSNRAGAESKRRAPANVDAGRNNGKISRRKDLVKRPDMTWHDHLVMLLSFGAEIEHALMVQYLYAAYSIGGDQIPENHRKTVGRWRTSIIAVAKEEMGHLLTVQNMLTLLGAPVHLRRENFPYDQDYSPFRCELKPFSRDTLTCYIFAEMPETVGLRERSPFYERRRSYEKWDEAEESRIIEAVKERMTVLFPKTKPHRVGELYRQIIKLISDRERIPESAFREETYTMQASFDDWGRGYKPEPYEVDVEGDIVTPSGVDEGKPRRERKLPEPSDRRAHVLVERMATRTEAVEVLRRLAGQGEAPHLRLESGETGEPSHYERFIQIYREWDDIDKEFKRKHRGKTFNPALDVPNNPTTLRDADEAAAGIVNGKARKASTRKKADKTFIEAKCAQHMADLFNQRYRMMLGYLEHSFRLARVDAGAQPSLRAMVMHRVFGEMYNLKAIAGLLFRLPLSDDRGSGCAGPPFEMPYSLDLPQADKDIWRRHLDLLGSAQRTCHALLGYPKQASKENADKHLGQPHATIFDDVYDEIYDDIHDRSVRRTQGGVAEQLNGCGGDVYLKALVDLDNRTRAWMTTILGADPRSSRRRELTAGGHH